MSCGLGAVILIFMLVKHHIEDSAVELENLEQDVQQLLASQQDSLQILENIEQEIITETAQQEAHKKQIATMQSALAAKKQDVQKTTQAIEKLKDGIKDIKISKPQDVIENKEVYEENYLLGLKVEGKKIGILLDSSASMTNEKLIDIIKTKTASKAEKQKASKWVRTKKIVAWLLARLPKKSEVVVVIFNEQAQSLGMQGWTQATNATGLNAILSDLNTLIPEGGTNLQLGLQAMNKYAPSHLYIVTDGLPTKGESRYKSLNPFARCNSLLGRANKISGECRVKLFQQTLSESAPRPGVQINVILLPIEGDPAASNQYWRWAARTGGLVISPAYNWP
ncbi:Secreted protein, containing von Willebrand factor (VWF) type A domain [uncultured Candidatus Thioglobus sp.]|nr:Secreted protein, containing von Willebrand factor (VWF) type A domain [uncultured Candidatus Thioglobus sp.]